jgi:hypothetical protein
MTAVGEGEARYGKFSTFLCMATARRWLLASPDKVPHYVSGQKRNGTLDTPEDLAQLAPYHLALEALEARPGWLLGFALGPDGSGRHWQGVDFDKVSANRLADLANGAPGYVEMSPSGAGAHAIGYGQPFTTLPSNGSGIEAYSAGRYFTVTERQIRDCEPVCLAGFVAQALAPRHGAGRPAASAIGVEIVPVDAKTVTELRSALMHMRSDDYHIWFRMGLALKELGDIGRGLWMDWSATSEKFNGKEAAKKWDGFEPRSTSYQAVFAEAQRQGWVNPASNAAQLAPAAPSSSTITLEFAMSTDTATVRLDYLVDPFLPAGCVVGFFGRGSTSKSSFLASLAAHVSASASSLWVSVEEPADWIKVRHIKSGGAEGTLAVVKAVPSKKDAQGRVIASSFNIYEHLEAAINEAHAGFAREGRPPLRLVVLDTAVGLTGWAKGESPNDDAAVKKLLGYLQGLAERLHLTIAVIGHANKGKHEHFADTVMGAAAWTNSPRLSFVHAAGLHEDYSYVMRVAKTNLVTFGCAYKTEPVHVLYERADGPSSVLVRVVPGEIVWGDRASLEMFEAATKKPKDDEGNGGGDFLERRRSAIDAVIEAIEQLVAHAGPNGHVTREQVEEHHGKQLDRKRWLLVDQNLQLHPFVIVERGDKNRLMYRLKT